MRRFIGGWRRHPRWGAAATSAIVLGLCGAGAATQPAGATLLVQSHTDPAGDPALFSYHIDFPGGLAPADFQLSDGQESAHGPFAGQAVAAEVPPAGWYVADIRCVGPDPAAFAIDVPNGRVTVQHRINDEQICSFTNRRNPVSPSPAAPPAGSSPAPSEGIAPAPPTSAVRQVAAPRRAALTAVAPRRRGAMGRVVLVKRSVVKTQLLWHGHVVGTSRVVRAAGRYDVTVRLRPSVVRKLRHAGRKRVTMTLRMVVVPNRGATRVIRSGVIVPLR